MSSHVGYGAVIQIAVIELNVIKYYSTYICLFLPNRKRTPGLKTGAGVTFPLTPAQFYFLKVQEHF